MARIESWRVGWRVPGTVAAVVAAAVTLLALVAGPATSAAAGTRSASAPAASSPGPTASVPAQLTRSFAAARHIPGSAISGVRAGSLHVGRADGAEWALATFTPSASASQQMAAGFQDGAATGVFRQADGAWRLVRTGPYGCGAGLPTALRRDWGLADPASCSATITAQRAAAQRGVSAGPGQSIANIALSQVGVSDTPVVTSFAGVDCDPYSTLVAGFSANADGCGYDQNFSVQNENEAWCSDFNKWVWERAGVTADMNTLNAGSVSFYDWALDQGESLAPDSGTPAAGDSIVFFGPGAITPDRYADHVGIVTAVNADGTINMVNGDFLGASNVSVEYDTGISLTSWAAGIWGVGEQWVIVAPPSAAQQPDPKASLSGPHVAVTGTTGMFHARAAEPGGSISEYYWTFGDGRTTNTTGQDVTHVFAEDGRYTVTVTVTSSFGTITTRTWDVTVLGTSSAVAAAPSDVVWFAATPVDEYLFLRSGSGLTAESWDGASWLQVAVPGQPSAGGGLAALSYPDPAANDAMTPHAYFRAADGSLAQTYLVGSAWVTKSLPGKPAADSGLVATTTAGGGPAVFYVDVNGRLAESALAAADWTTRTLPGASAVPASLALAETSSGAHIFSANSAGLLTVTEPAGAGWQSTPLPARIAAGSSLAAVTTPSGQARAFFTDRRGRLAQATQAPGGQWLVSELPGAPASATSLAATNYLLPAGQGVPLGEELFFLTPSGQPAVVFSAGPGWQTAALPGTAAAIIGASAYQVAGQPMQLFLSTGTGGPLEDTTGGAPSGTWSSASLPDMPATFGDRVLLYAATPADDATALNAAAVAGLAAIQVTRSFATAWDAMLSGSYLVISVGLPATDALYSNVCGWDNPSGDIPGTTPFYYVSGPLDQLPGTDAFENGAAATASQAQEIASDLAYYAVHGALPPGVTSLPSAASPQYVCSGSPS